MTSSRPKQILLMDDSPVVLNMTRRALEGAGYEVTLAHDLAELAEVQRRAFDLVLMDVQMPEAYGDDVAMVLRTVRGMKAPIYLFSSLEEQELALRALDADIDGYVLKKDGIDALLTRVAEIVGR